jgi:peptidoglycan/LPS O-acetylase OafA/YrhL
MTAFLVVLIAMLAVGMHAFRRGDLARQPGGRIAAFHRFCGRYSLEIYAAQIILLAGVGALWNHFDPPDTDDDDDE